MGRKSFGAKPLCYPQPVFILATYNLDGTANAMNAAWGGISEENELTLCIGADHRTTENFLRTGAFTVSMADAAHVEACDYFGMATGKMVENKVESTGMTVSRSELVDAPILNELAVCLECKVKTYDEESCRLVAEIVNVSVDDAFLADGNPDVSKIRPLIFDPFNNAYNVIGEKVGDAFRSGTKYM